RANLATVTEMRMRVDPITRARNQAEVPLATALSLMVRERLTGQAPPGSVRTGLGLVSDWIEEKAGSDLDALGFALDDQAAFAALASKLLRDLELIEGDDQAPSEGGEDQESEGEDQESEGESDEQDQQSGDEGEGQAAMRAEQSEGGEGEDEGRYEEDEILEADDGLGDDAEEGLLPVRPNRPLSDMPPQFDYRIFTTRFDEVIDAGELCEPDELGRVRSYLDQQLG